MNKNNFKKYHFFNLPQPLKEADYQGACDLVVSDLKDNPNVFSLYLCGNQWLPGVSDIDIIVVTRDAKPLKIKMPWQLSDNSKFIFIHKYGLLNKKNFQKVFYLLKLFPEKNRFLAGRRIKIRKPLKELDRDSYNSLQAFFVFDYLINKLLLIPKYLQIDNFNVRNVLGEIYSIGHTIALIKQLTDKDIAPDFCQKIEQLRHNWFSLSEQANLGLLLKYLSEAPGILLEIVSALDWYTQNKFPLGQLPSKITFSNERYYIKFIKNWHKENFLNDFKKTIHLKNPFSQRDIFNFYLVLPRSLVFYLYAYSSAPGCLADLLSQALSFKTEVKMDQGIEKHARYINELLSDVKKSNGFLSPVFPYGFFFSQRTLPSKIGSYSLKFLRFFIR